MNRFRSADAAASSAPLSDSARSITGPTKDAEKQEARVEVAREHANLTNTPTIHQEDERFEWGEVIRGSSSVE